jgi:pimeloyl-ACP methyl ester carboxylesterase
VVESEPSEASDTVLLIHGFGDSAPSWSSFAQELGADYRIVLPELPGFGESEAKPDVRYSFATQAEIIAAFVRERGIGRAHVIGESMGGAIASIFAARHPDRIRSLLLLCPAGVKQPEQSAYIHALEQGRNPLVVRSEAQFRRMMRYTFNDPPGLIPWYVPKEPILDAIVERLRRRAGFHERVLRDIRDTDRYPLHTALPRIEAKTRVLWGQQDLILDPSALEEIKERRPATRIELLEGCGHALHVECQDEVLHHFRELVRESS